MKGQLRSWKLALSLAFLMLGVARATKVDGTKIYWHAAGSARIKKTVIFVHGWNGDSLIWRKQISPLVAANYRVIVLDLPGHGQSGSPKDGRFSMDLFAQAIEKIRR